MKQAKPSKRDNDRVLEFLRACEAIFQERIDPRDEDCIQPIDEDDAFALLDEMWPKVAPCWQRVYFAGHCAIENACDPNLPHLDLKPELRLNPELLEIVRELATVAHMLYESDRSTTLTHLMTRAQSVIAELDKSTKESK